MVPAGGDLGTTAGGRAASQTTPIGGRARWLSLLCSVSLQYREGQMKCSVANSGQTIILICISNFSHALLLGTRIVCPSLATVTEESTIIVDPAIPKAFAISPTTDEADHSGGSIRDAILIGQTRDIIVLLNI